MEPYVTLEEKERPTWEQTWLRFGPLSAIAALFLAFCSIAASLTILVTSNGASKATWTIQPSVYLGIATAVANQAIRYAAMQGVAIAWWSSAAKGSTIGGLHRQWSVGNNVWKAITAGVNIGPLGVVCLASTLVAVDTPLLQRATQVESAPIMRKTLPLDVHVAPEIPSGFTGHWYRLEGELANTYFGTRIPTWNGSDPNNIAFAPGPQFLPVVKSIFENSPMTGLVHGCAGTCHAKIKAPAVSIDSCRSRIMDVSNNIWWNGTLNQAGEIPWTRYHLVNYLGLHLEESESLNMVTGFSHEGGTVCWGWLNVTMCSLASAIGEYDVTISQDVVKLVPPGMPTIVARANNTKILRSENDWYKSTLAGIADLYWQVYGAVAMVKINDGRLRNTRISTSGPAQSYLYKQRNDGCYSYSDPREDMLTALNKMMFRTGAYAAQVLSPDELQSSLDPGLVTNSTVLGTVVGTQSVFRSTYAFFLAAALVELISIVSVLFVCWGWWNLGRAVSFSPLEVAKAFDAPLLRTCGPNVSDDDMAEALGDLPVRYGAVSTLNSAAAHKITFGNPSFTCDLYTKSPEEFRGYSRREANAADARN